MFDAPHLAAFKDFSTACVIVAFQVYNVWQHRQNKSAIATTQEKQQQVVSATKDDLDAAHSAIERLAIRLNGGDRRKPPASTAPTPEPQGGWPAQRRSDREPKL